MKCESQREERVETSILNGLDLKRMLDSGLARLTDRYKEVDSLNVFPVPDGDTGTNMYLTLVGAVNETDTATDKISIGDVAAAAARGALMGARGNSGVILSQLLRGLAKGLKDMDRVTGKVFAEALDEGVKAAFKAVMKPVEGTILTVAREAAKEAVRAAGQNSAVINILQASCIAAEKTLDLTPELLPVLKEAGVVDAGGMGWLIILQGFCLAQEGGEIVNANYAVLPAQKINAAAEGQGSFKYPYCTEALVKKNKSNVLGLREKLSKYGDSLMVVETEGYIRVHIHSDHPGKVLEICLKYGSLKNVKINNMKEQATGKTSPKDAKPYGIVAVAPGEGLKEIMESLGADRIVLGGQTMNPSIRELLQGVEEIDSDTVIILPNNSNILMTANQVGSLTPKQIKVIPATTVPQGIAALMAYTPGTQIDKITGLMNESLKRVKTGEVTYAVRKSKYDGQVIKKGSIIGLFDDKIVNVGSNVTEVVLSLLKKMVTPADEVCTLYYGDMITSLEAKNLMERIAEQFADMEFELHYGGQPLYYYIISVE